LAVIEAEPELFCGAFDKGFIRDAAPIQSLLTALPEEAQSTTML